MLLLISAALSLGVTAFEPPALNGLAQHAARSWVETYQWFHRNPEVSLAEEHTAARLAQALTGLGLEVYEHIGGHGVVAVLRNPRHATGPVVLYRADMDALPVQEKTGLAYASSKPGVMHACGHDIHLATALGTLQVLKEHPDAWRGTVVFVGQPAEEIGQGARAMLQDSRFQRVMDAVDAPTVVLAWHDSANLPAGAVGVGSGFITANVDAVDIVLHGKGGHGSEPEQAVDATVMGAEVVLQLQTIVSRRVAPGAKAVVTVGVFDAGTKRNIIANTATLKLTVRSYDADVRKALLSEITHIAQSVATSYHAPQAPDVQVNGEKIDGVYNDPQWVALLREAFIRQFGAGQVHVTEPHMIGEDFGLFAAHFNCPGVLMELGAVSPATYAQLPAAARSSLHSETWAPDAEPTLATGIAGMVRAVMLAGESAN